MSRLKRESKMVTMKDVTRKLFTTNTPFVKKKTMIDMQNIGRGDKYISTINRCGDFSKAIDIWRGEPCIIVAAGPSLKGFDLKRTKNIKSIVINHVIEDYDDFDVLFFLDQRFLDITTYDVKNFKGMIACQNTCSPPPGTNNVMFKVRNIKSPCDLNIEKGLYGTLSALTALHFALVTGADPIYLIGVDCGGTNNAQAYHHKDDYTGELKTEEKLKKFKAVAPAFDKFAAYKDRIINLSSISEVTTFQKKNVDDIPIFNQELEIIKKNEIPTICNIIGMDSMEEMGDISRQVYKLTAGDHIFANINSEIPEADLYVLDCFINQAEKFKNFKPSKGKVVSIVHSSSTCSPADSSDAVVLLTESHRKIIKHSNIHVIPAGINCNDYDFPPNYDNKVFGRITRYSRGKVHKETPFVYKRILEKYPESECRIISSRHVNWGEHERIKIIDDVKINEHEKKARELNKLSLFAAMHGTFKETFSLALLEAMAAGLCIVLYSEAPQPHMREVLADCGIWCNSVEEFEKTIIELLPDSKTKGDYGLKARLRAEQFTVDKMVYKYNQLFKELLK